MPDPADARIMRLFTLDEHDAPGDFQPEMHVVGLSDADLAAVVGLSSWDRSWTWLPPGGCGLTRCC